MCLSVSVYARTHTHCRLLPCPSSLLHPYSYPPTFLPSTNTHPPTPTQGGVPPTPGSGGAPPAITASGPITLHRLHGCSAESLGGSGLFLLDAWHAIYLYVGRDVGPQCWQALFGLEGLPPEAHAQGEQQGKSK